MVMERKDKIDFVLLWVDGNDPVWRQEREKYAAKASDDNREIRFRDWDNLQYIFRGIEKYAPWVHKVHFVTWGHLPNWLNVKHPKLRIVNHKDFMDEKYLPCFNSEAIESCIYKIRGLSEHFVYFNDDCFLLRPMRKRDFFVNGLPCDSAVLNVHCCEIENGTLAHFLDIGVINRYFKMRDVIKNNKLKWFSLKYGFNVLRNLYLLPCPRFPGILMQHLPQSFNKSTFYEVWEKEPELLDMTCKNKFRNLLSTNQYIFKEWQIAKGEFMPRSLNIGITLGGKEDINYGCEVIEKQKFKMLSYNEGEMTENEFEYVKYRLIESFEKIFPEKSLFEI